MQHAALTHATRIISTKATCSMQQWCMPHTEQCHRAHTSIFDKIQNVELCRQLSSGRGSLRLVVCDMEQSVEKTTLFIEDYHNSLELWTNKSTVYKDNKVTNDNFKQLASEYDCNVLEVKKI